MAFINYDQNMEYFTADGEYVTFTTFDEVYDHFTTDHINVDELILQVMKDKKTGYVYTYVKSYPGDNEYGVYVNSFGEAIAEVQDGDLVVNGDYCW